MQLGPVRLLLGPNRWSRQPVVEAEVTGSPEEAQAVLAAAQDFQRAIDFHAALAASAPAGRPGAFLVALDFDEPALGEACLRAGFDRAAAAAAGGPFDADGRVADLKALAFQTRLGPSTRSIAEAARRRDIPVRRLTAGSMLQLGWGCKLKRVWTAETDDTPIVAEVIAQDKELTRAVLAGVGVPVPHGRPVTDVADAWAAAEELGPPVVVKPRYGNQGRGVFTNLTTREQVAAAYEEARREGQEVVVETHAPGRDHRLLVAGGRLAAAALREPAQVVGDGRSTVAELVAAVNADPRRTDGHGTALSFIKLDAVASTVLAEQGMTPESVPSAGTRVLIRRNANLSTGGTATDVTDLVHPDVAAQAVAAARAIGLDVAGVDVVCEDCGRPLAGQRGAVVEVNAGPGLRMHLEPSAGRPRDVGAAIVDALFPAGETGRVPVVAVAGVGGAVTARLIAWLCRAGGRAAGLACRAGLFADGHRATPRDAATAAGARSVLANRRTQVAVLEVSPESVRADGLGFDRADVTVVTGLAGEGWDRATAKVVPAATSPVGCAVLDAADPDAAALAADVPGPVLFFGTDEADAVLAAHRQAGGPVAFVRGGMLTLAEGPAEMALVGMPEVPGMRAETALAAAAAAWRLGISLDHIREGLRTFPGE